MDLQNIQEQLNTEFAKADIRIIFWFDDKGDYAEEVAEIQLDTAKLHILDGENWLYSKWLLNESDPEGKYLVYAPFARPSDSENPLADMYYYSTPYYTDRVSQMSQEIGIDTKYKEHLAGYGSFWRSTVRIEKFKALNIDHYNTETLDIGLLAVLMDVKTPSFEEIVKKLILTDAEEYVKAITDYGLMATFWELCKKYFGYNVDGNIADPSIENLAMSFVVTYAAATLQMALPKNLGPYIVKKRNDAVVFVRNIMDNVSCREAYDALSLHTDVLLRSTGLEPDKFSDRAKWLLVARMIPLVENNFNLCELGPRSTGKSYIYEQISPNSILVAGGQTTVANLFYNMSSHTVGLVGMWDCVAFDEVAGIKFKDKDGIQIMKGYMASGAFSRGKAEITAKASMVFVGNINQSVDTLLKTSSLFDPFPPEMGTDTAFLDRMHCYIPGWEIPKYRPESFTNDYGFITDYLSEFMRELRKDSYSDIADKYFKLGNNLNQRDTIAVRKMISGFIKLLYPDGEASKEEVREVVEISLELRRRVKEQLKKIGGMEFYDVNFSYIDNDSFEEHYVGVPEQGAGKLIPEGMGKSGSLYTVSKSKTGMIGCYHLETQMMPGNGKLTCTGIGSGKESKEATNTAFNYLKANGNAISGQISTTTKDYIINYQDMQGIGMTGSLALPTLIAISSAALNKPMVSSMAVLGEISIGGTLIKVEELASTLQVCLDSGAKKVLLPITSAADLGTVPSDLVGAFSLIFYSSPEEAVYKALGVE